MKAVVMKKIGDVVLADVPKPRAGEGRLVLKTEFCSICRTDYKIFSEGHRDMALPVIPGHELAVLDEKTGKRYVVWPGVACGSCPMCKSGMENLCPVMKVMGFHRDGGFAEYVSVPKASLIPIPKGLQPELACFSEIVGCCFNALSRASRVSGKTALIVGAGQAGLCAGLVLKSAGAKVSFLEKSHQKIDAARAVAEGQGFHFHSADKHFYDVVITAAADVSAFEEAVRRANPAGGVVFFSGVPKNSSVMGRILNEVHYRQLTLVGSYGCTRKNMTDALKLISRSKGFFERLTEKKITLEEVPDLLRKWVDGKTFKHVIKF